MITDANTSYSCPDCEMQSIVSQTSYLELTLYDFSNNLCYKCLNNPKNGGSCICNCILGTMKIN